MKTKLELHKGNKTVMVLEIKTFSVKEALENISKAFLKEADKQPDDVVLGWTSIDIHITKE